MNREVVEQLKAEILEKLTKTRDEAESLQVMLKGGDPDEHLMMIFAVASIEATMKYFEPQPVEV